LNEMKMLNVKGAWETVQHSACASLVDELKIATSQQFRQLASGHVSRGVRLPLSDAALNVALHDHKQGIKSLWKERSVGDESVRKEYWKELKDAIAEEELGVRQQNARLADQKLKDTLNKWQRWLNDESATWTTGESICADLGGLMEQMPAQPVSRVVQQAIEAGGRHVSAVRESLAVARERGEQAAQQAGATRTELEVLQAEVQMMQIKARDMSQSEQGARTMQAELNTHIEEMKAQRDLQTEKEKLLQIQLNESKEMIAKSDVERLASERCARGAADIANAERIRLQEALDELRNSTSGHQNTLDELKARHEQETLALKSAVQAEKNEQLKELEQKCEELRQKLEEAERANNSEPPKKCCCLQ